MYIGTQPYHGFRARHTYTATAGQTSFSGAGAENVSLSYSDEMYIDVYQNGVKLSPADYTATSGTTVVLAQGASVSDIVEVVKYDTFAVADTVSAKDGGGFGGAVSFAGAVTANAGVVVDNITIDGTEIDLSSGDLTLDVAGDIILDADGSDIFLKDGGTEFGRLSLASSGLQIYTAAQDADIYFKGNDGGSTVTALTLDMSEAGKAIFNNYVQVNDRIVGADDLVLVTTDSNEKIHMDSDGYIKFETAGSERMRINSSGYFHFSSNTSDSEFYDVTYTSSISTSNTQPALFIENSGDGNVYGLGIDFTDAAPDNNTSYFLICQDSSAVRLRIWADGDIQNHDNSYGALSDEKLKEQIADASSQWEDIKALKVRKFKMKEDVAKGDSDDHWRLGVVAQEVETAGMNGLVKDNPELVTNSDGELEESGTTTKSVKYSILYMKAVKALQEAMTRIETLEAEVKALKGE